MPLQVHPIFGLSDIPGDVAAAAGVAITTVFSGMALMIRTLYNRNVAVEDRNRIDSAAMAAAMRDSSATIDRLTDELREKRRAS